MRSARTVPRIAPACGLLVLAACGSPYSVVQVDPRTALSAPGESAPETEAAPVSERTLETLRIQNLEELWESFPELAVRTLDQLASGPDVEDRDLLVALAELSWHEARHMDAVGSSAAAGFYLLSAARAYTYLVAPEDPMTRAFDPDFDFLAGIYRQAARAYLRYLFQRSDGKLRNHSTEVLAENYRVRVERGSGVWDPDSFDEFLLADGLEIRGFRHHHRQPGLGVPLVGVRENRRVSPVERFYPPEGFFHPVTAVLRFDADAPPPTDELALFDDFVAREGQRTAVLSLYDPLRTPSIEINGRPVPLAADFTAPYGLLMARADLRRLSTQGLLDVEKAAEHEGLFMIEPYDPDKVPVIMIHGLRSSAHIWAEMTNDINGDPELARAFQIWHYIYPSALPYLYAGSVLRDQLEELRHVYDPQGVHKAMKSMVVVAHSMGGLMAKTLISSSGRRIWDTLVDIPPEELKGEPEHVERFRKTFLFEPLPYVDRVVFISTPHRGSRMADAFVGRLGAALAQLPDDYKETFESITEANWEAIRPEVRKRLAHGGPKSIRALSPRHQILQILADIPIDAAVKAHTIIGDRDAITGDPEVDSDGVVTLESAHLEEAVSEVTVPSRHDAYNHPLTILEVKRILREHLRGM